MNIGSLNHKCCVAEGVQEPGGALIRRSAAEERGALC